MKKILLLLCLPSFLFAQEEYTDSVTIKALEDFDIYAIGEIAEGVNNFEELEQALNDSSTHINNVDLNGDGEIDFLRITEYQDGNAHTAIISAVLGDDDFQTLVSIEMEKTSDTKATLQLIGEESFYGELIILEPESGSVDISGEEQKEEEIEKSYEDNLRGPSAPIDNVYVAPPPVHVTIVYGVYSPGYVLWVSPVVYGVYPMWYRPWPVYRRAAWRHRHYRHHHHHRNYHRTSSRRSASAHHMHNNNRKSSPHTNNRKSTSPSTQPKTGSPSKSGNNKGGSRGGSRGGGRRR